MKNKDWLDKAYKCHRREGKEHSWMPMSKSFNNVSEHVTILMCAACFHTIDVHEAYKYKELSPYGKNGDKP
jgi:hypothetical protein